MHAVPTDLLHGVIVIDKPAGLTSAAVVARVKRALAADAVGHTGTLDPLATGVLPIVVGEGTKLAAFLLADDKEYDAELELGVTTDTLDADGTVLSRASAAHVDEAALLVALAAHVGPQAQVPPMYSALKQDGKRLYDLARQGVEVDRAPREIRIDLLALESFTPPRARVHVACTKGTYVRALVRDLGARLGCGATLTALRRTRAGRFTIAEAISLDALTPARAAQALVSPTDALAHLPAVHLDPAGVVTVKHGKPLPLPPGAQVGDRFRLLTPEGALAAVVEVQPSKIVYLRVFNYGLTPGPR